MLHIPNSASNSSDCNLGKAGGVLDTDCLYMPLPPHPSTLNLDAAGMIRCSQCSLNTPHASPRSERSVKSRSSSTNSSRRSSQKRKGSQRQHRNPSRHGSTKDKKRLLSVQGSSSSALPNEPEEKHRRAVRIIFTISVILILMSVIIVATTLMMSGKLEEMVKNKVNPDAKVKGGNTVTGDVSTKTVTASSSDKKSGGMLPTPHGIIMSTILPKTMDPGASGADNRKQNLLGSNPDPNGSKGMLNAQNIHSIAPAVSVPTSREDMAAG